MKELFEKNKKKLLFLAIFVAVFIVYSLFIKKDPQADLVIEQAAQNSVAAQDNRELLNQLQSLNAITLNTEIFTSRLFNLLQDNTIVIENRKPEGRKNPFLPIGVDDGSYVPDQGIQGATVNNNGLLDQKNQNGGSVPVPGAIPEQIKTSTTTSTTTKQTQ